ncbi:hypothetical protein P7C70_g5180, partial [Phenoliferia sp. Uapishka_3]
MKRPISSEPSTSTKSSLKSKKQKVSNRPRNSPSPSPSPAPSDEDSSNSANEEEQDEAAHKASMLAALQAHQAAFFQDALPNHIMRAGAGAGKGKEVKEQKAIWEMGEDGFEDDEDEDDSEEEEEEEPEASTSSIKGPIVVSFEEPRGATVSGSARDMQSFMSARVKNARPTFSVADLVNVKPFSHKSGKQRAAPADLAEESELSTLDSSLSTLLRPLLAPSTSAPTSQLPALLSTLPIQSSKPLKGLTPLPSNAPRTLRRGQEAKNLVRARGRDEAQGILAGAKRGREATTLKEKRKEEGGDKRERGMKGAVGKMGRGGLTLTKAEIEHVTGSGGGGGGRG